MRYRLRLEYDGTDFRGWQLQPDARTVQGELEAALQKVTGDFTRVTGAGRTDAGVHARGQAAHFDSETRLAARELQRALNAVLRADVAVLDLAAACAGFDARHDALWKTYRYRMVTRPSPLRSRVCWQLRGRLDLGAMRVAAAELVGTHDFAAFRGAPGGAPADELTRRTLDALDLTKREDELHLDARGRSFLRYMVRNLAGTLVEVGRGQRAPGEIAEILASRDRSRAGPTAPAHGLCLEHIEYPQTSG